MEPTTPPVTPALLADAPPQLDPPEVAELPTTEMEVVDLADLALIDARAAISALEPALGFTETLPTQDPAKVMAAWENAKAKQALEGVRHEIVTFPLSTGFIPHYVTDEDGKQVQATYVIIVKRVSAGIYRAYQTLLNTPGATARAHQALVQSGLVFPDIKEFMLMVEKRPDMLDLAHTEILKLTEQQASKQVAPLPAFLRRLGL